MHVTPRNSHPTTCTKHSPSAVDLPPGRRSSHSLVPTSCSGHRPQACAHKLSQISRPRGPEDSSKTRDLESNCRGKTPSPQLAALLSDMRCLRPYAQKIGKLRAPCPPLASSRRLVPARPYKRPYTRQLVQARARSRRALDPLPCDPQEPHERKHTYRQRARRPCRIKPKAAPPQSHQP